MANLRAEQLINSIKVPSKLSDRQVQICKLYASKKLEEGFTVGSFCKSQGMSTATFYKYMEDELFSSYLKEVSDAIIPADELQAFQLLKKKVLKIAEKDSPSLAEINLFMTTFPYLVSYDNRMRSSALGLDDESIKKGNTKTIQERKESLLKRLKPEGEMK